MGGLLLRGFLRVLAGSGVDADGGVREAPGAGHMPMGILNDALTCRMTWGGARFAQHEFCVPEMLVAARNLWAPQA